MTLQIVPATEAHALVLSRTLRAADAREIMAIGSDPEWMVLEAWRGSLFANVALVNGDVAGVWGLFPTDDPNLGQPWFLTAPCIEGLSVVAFARCYRAEVKTMLKVRPRLENFVDVSYDGAVRMIALAGFRLDEPKPYGPLGSLFRRFEMRTE